MKVKLNTTKEVYNLILKVLVVIFYFVIFYRADMLAKASYDPSVSIGIAFTVIFPLLIIFLAFILKSLIVFLFKGFKNESNHVIEILFYIWYSIFVKDSFVEEWNWSYPQYSYEDYLGISFNTFFGWGLLLLFCCFVLQISWQ